MVKIVCLNGHIGSGKDVAATELGKMGFENRKLSDPLTYAVRDLFTIESYNGKFNKNEVYPEAFGRTFRHWQIAISNMLKKESFYKGPLAHMLIRNYPKVTDESIVISDLGTFEELEVFADAWGPENILLISITSQEALLAPTDGRKYISLWEARKLGVKMKTVNNDFTNRFKHDIREVVNEWLLTSEGK